MSLINRSAGKGRSLGRRAGLAAALCTVIVLGAVAWLYVSPPGSDAPRVIVSVDESAWNRLGLNRLTYVRKLRLAGLQAVLVNADDGMASAQHARALLENAAGLVLTGGGDVSAARYDGEPSLALDVSPRRDDFEFALLEAAMARGLPVLGLCRGAQLMNVHLGGTLGDFRADADRYARHHNLFRGHDVTLASGSRLREWYGTNRLEAVTAWHGQHVATPGDGVRIVASSADGTPEAFIVDGYPFAVGVQWHPEMPPWDAGQRPLFEAFAAAIRAAGPEAAAR